MSRELVEALAAKAPKESTATSNGAGKIAPGKVEEFLACVMTEHRGRMYWNGGVSIADLFATSALYESGSRLEPSYWIGKTSGSRGTGSAMVHFKPLVELCCQQLPFFDITQSPANRRISQTNGRKTL